MIAVQCDLVVEAVGQVTGLSDLALKFATGSLASAYPGVHLV